MTEPHEPDRPQGGSSNGNGPESSHGGDRGAGDWRGAWKQRADGSWYQDTPASRSERHEAEPTRDKPGGSSNGNGPESSHGGDRGTGGRRATWKQAADGSWYRDTPASRSERHEAEPTRDEPARQEEQARQEEKPTGKRAARSKWTTAGFVVLAGVLVVALVRALLTTGNQGAITTQGPASPPPKPPILLGGAPSLTSPPLVTLNPGLLRQGAPVAITGIGFDPGSAVDVRFIPEGSRQPIAVPSTQVAPDGSFGANLVVPLMPNSSGGTITAAERGSTKTARTDAPLQTGVGFMALNAVYGKPGDMISVTANGFQPGEKIDAYWGRIGGAPAAQLQANQSGGLLRVPMSIGVAPAGSATLILVGEQSRTTATAAFSMGSLYPNAGVMPYAVKPAQPFAVGGNGFMPGERVLLYINSSSGPPVRVLQADQRGTVGGASFIAPYKLRGKQTLELVGEQSRATAMTGFQTLPYSAMAQPSTWGGMPGTRMTFYARGFAPNEVVLVYAGRTPTNPGELVTAFRVDARGIAVGAGHYTIPADARGPMSLQLVGRQSEATATATLTVQPRPGVKVPPAPKYVLPPDLATDPPPPG